MAHELIVELDHPDIGPVRQPKPAARFDRTPAQIQGPAPRIGEHSAAILAELGFGAAEIGTAGGRKDRGFGQGLASLDQVIETPKADRSYAPLYDAGCADEGCARPSRSNRNAKAIKFGGDGVGMAVLCFQSYVVKTPHHTILVDACIGNDKSFPHRPTWHRKSDSNWMQALKAAGVTVDDIDIVMCTHLHGDHVGWNTRLENGRWIPTFPNAKYLFSKKEFDYWDGVHRETPLDPMRDSFLPIIDAKKAELVTSDYAVDDHFRLTPTPGHTPDHFAVCAGRRGDQAVFTGDLIHSPIQARYPDLVMRVDYDQRQASATRRAFLERYCDTSTLCCTMHFPSPSVGHIKRWTDGFRCEPVAD